MAKYETKTNPTDVSVEQFLETVEPPVRRADADVLIEMMRDVTGYEPVMWGPSIIGFGKVHYEYATGHEGDMPIVGFSPRKAKHSLYLMSARVRDGDYLERLGKHSMGKACLYVTKLADVDLDVLREIIEVAAEDTANASECTVC